MKGSVYTLLIVESPVLAQIIQKLSPPSVYVLATEGYCWKPRFDVEQQKLIAVADPAKRAIRKELKEQSQWANSVIVATDSDPAGDFIAWSIARFMKANTVKRGRIHSLSKNGIISMLSDLQEIETDRLETKLKNRYLIKNEWYRNKQLPDYQLSGLISTFGEPLPYSHFIDENGIRFRSSQPIKATPDEYIEVKSVNNGNHFPIFHPLSTFDLISTAVSSGLALNFFDAQALLQQLFETTTDLSNRSLISYPRTDARAFYSETWENFQIQYLKLGSEGRLKPTFLRDIAEPETPHESIHPLDFSTKPSDVKGELTSNIGDLYALIYDSTIKSITIPDTLNHSYNNELRPDVYLYPQNNEFTTDSNHSIRPCNTVAELGYRLNEMGVLRPSEFGKSLDDWIEKGWIRVDQEIISPGRSILQNMHKAGSLKRMLTQLQKLSDNSSLKVETLREIFTSY